MSCAVESLHYLAHSWAMTPFYLSFIFLSYAIYLLPSVCYLQSFNSYLLPKCKTWSIKNFVETKSLLYEAQENKYLNLLSPQLSIEVETWGGGMGKTNSPDFLLWSVDN